MEKETLPLDEKIIEEEKALARFNITKNNDVISASYNGETFNRTYLFILMSFTIVTFVLALTIMIITLNVKTDSFLTWPIFLALAIISLALTILIMVFLNKSQKKWNSTYLRLLNELQKDRAKKGQN